FPRRASGPGTARAQGVARPNGYRRPDGQPGQHGGFHHPGAGQGAHSDRWCLRLGRTRPRPLGMGRGGIVPSLRASMSDASMTGDVYLVTERMMLRRITATDVDDLTALDADPEVMKHVDPFAITPHARAGLPDFLCYRRLPHFCAYYERLSYIVLCAALARHD